MIEWISIAELEERLNLPLRAPTGVVFDTLCPGAFGVAPVGGRDPIYTSAVRDDAVAAATLVNTWQRGHYAVIPAEPPGPQWLVVGPETGPYLSRVEVASSETAARRLAAMYSAETGAPFSIARAL